MVCIKGESMCIRRFISLISTACLAIILLAFVSACATADEGLAAGDLDTLGISTFQAKDLAYGSHYEQKLDVYLPRAQNGPFPVMFLVHGGAWHWGDKSENEYSIEDYLNQGFAVININYRMGDMDFTIDEKLSDINSALSFIYQFREQWQLSDDLTLVGGSAGGHMVLQYGFTMGFNSVDRIISYCGPTDLSNPFYNSNGIDVPIAALFEAPQPSQEELQQASPFFSIPEEIGPAVIMIHGNADTTVDFMDSKKLHEALLDRGWDSTLIEIPGVDHDFEGTDWEWVYSIFGPWMERHFP